MRAAADPDPSGPAEAREPGLVLRIPAPDDGWVDRLPPAPDGAVVTVSLTDPAAAERTAGRLAELGYVPVGPAGADTGQRWADLMVARAVLDEDPSWRLRLTVDGLRVFDTGLGPVRLLLDQVLAAHAGADPRIRGG